MSFCAINQSILYNAKNTDSFPPYPCWKKTANAKNAIWAEHLSERLKLQKSQLAFQG